jgi:hypothetical protein
LCQTDSTDLTIKKTWNDPEEVDLKKTDQILVTVSDRAGQTFEPDMEESGAPKKKKKINKIVYLPTHTQKSLVGYGQTEIFLRMALVEFLTITV